MSHAPKKRTPAIARRAPISDQLRAIINARGMTPYAVSQVAGVSPSILTRFINGDRGLSTGTLDRVADALGLELRETRRGRITTAQRSPGC
jgi:transcriptional regulator with XRE-family HTH domain